MAALNLQEMVLHCRRELVASQAALAYHQQDVLGLCRCLRVWPCEAHSRFGLAASHWQARLEHFEPQLAALTEATAVLPVLPVSQRQ